MKRIPRRRFLYVLAGGGAGLAVAAPLATLPWQVPATGRHAGTADDPQQAPRNRITRTAWALGSDVTITALHEDEALARGALDSAFEELETVERVMSIYRPESQLSRLNQAGVCNDPHPYLIEVLQAAAAMSRRTVGAFDVTIQPLWETYWSAHGRGTQPTAADIDAARRRIDWRHVEISTRQVRLHGTGTAVTLNGLAQGYAADRATAALQQHGIEHALIDTGEFGSLGQGANTNGWKVGIQHPRHDEALIAVAKLAGRCLATSGDYATKFGPDFTTHHLLDPRTGYSAADLASVSIVAESGLAADALSTAAFILGFDDGRALVAETPGADALFVTKDGRTWSSSHFPLDETA